MLDKLNVWNQLGAILRYDHFFYYCLADWLAVNLKSRADINLNDDGKRIGWNVIFLVGCWLLWEWRCKRLFEHGFCLPTAPARLIVNYAVVTVSCSKVMQPQVTQRQISISWVPSDERWVKLNTDGSFRAASHSTSCGGVIRDSSGRWLAGFTANMGTSNCVLAKIWRVFYGLQLAARGGFKKVVVEADTWFFFLMNFGGSRHLCGHSLGAPRD